MNLFKRYGLLSLGAAAGLMCGSCVNVNKSLGESMIPDSQMYDIYTAEFPIEDIEQEMADSLSSFSMYKFTFGAIRDEAFGLTTKEASFTLVPVSDTLDFGKNAKFRQFHLSAVADSTSYADLSQEYILQSVNVYELDKALDYTKLSPEVSYSKKRITDGIPVYNGKDSLSFNFSKEFGEKYMKIQTSDLDTLPNYTKKFPGIVITTDTPAGNGGRINMFRLPIAVNKGTIYGSYAELKFTADYGDRKQVDTSFIFYLGPMSIYDLGGVTSTSVTTYPQAAFDQTVHSSKSLEGKADKTFVMEGGRGIKPVIKAKPIRDKVLEIVSQKTDAPSGVVISKATLVMPFEFPDNYIDMYMYPAYISPTCRIKTDKSLTFASITDSSVSDENQGDINRSLCQYAPDVTHHLQAMLKLTDESKIENYDIWFLAMARETVATASSSSSSSYDSDYYQQLMYYNYYNSMYNGYGYGGYGGYGNYGYGNNYYNYMMLQQMYAASASSSSSASTTTKQTMMDSHRYYKAVFNGPGAERKPIFKFTYAVPKAGK